MNSLMMRLRLSTFGKGDDVKGDAKVPPAAHTGPLAMTELSSSLLEDALVRLELSSSLLEDALVRLELSSSLTIIDVLVRLELSSSLLDVIV